jgi:hypothetical protein
MRIETVESHFSVAIIIVGFRNPHDIIGCLRSLACANTDPTFEVFISENGGPQAFDALVAALEADDTVCVPASDAVFPAGSFAFERRLQFSLIGLDGAVRQRVSVAEMPDNLGYAGGVNAWLRPLLRVAGWRGVWILNPDTEPRPDALAELVNYAARRGKGMVGSRLILITEPERVQTRGLAWQKLRASVVAIDRYALASVEPDIDELERRLDAPSGASIYATRELIDRIGLMDERYFLYVEDLEWGCRAKKSGAVGYAHRSIVPHKGGTTIGTASRRIDRSRLSVYLESRNRILFVRKNFPLWLPWTVVMGLAHAATFTTVGAFGNLVAALRGLAAGVAGEFGKPKSYS